MTNQPTETMTTAAYWTERAEAARAEAAWLRARGETLIASRVDDKVRAYEQRALYLA